ncbi:MAG: hypothetical protein ACLTTJ_05070 [Blautia sp.]
MFSKLKRILHPENMLFKMIILNCGLLLLVTLVAYSCWKLYI